MERRSGNSAVDDLMEDFRIDVLAQEKRRLREVVDFSAVTDEALERAGVVKRHLHFSGSKRAELVSSQLGDSVEAKITELHDRLKYVYDHVNVETESGRRMIIDTILIALPEIISSEDSNRTVSIQPDMGGDWQVLCTLKNTDPRSKYKELKLDGHFDYLILEHEDIPTHRATMESGPEGGRLRIARHCLLVTRFVFDGESSRFPASVAQAIALLKITEPKPTEIRFCATDSFWWYFFVLKEEEDGKFVYWQSAAHMFDKGSLDRNYRLLLLTLLEWLRPTVPDLYRLPDA